VREILKVFVHSPPPLEKEGFVRIVELTIPKMTTLSMTKRKWWYTICVSGGYRGMGRTDKMDSRAKGESQFFAIGLYLLDSVQCPDR